MAKSINAEIPGKIDLVGRQVGSPPSLGALDLEQR
jgi:hypothetical protein